MHWLSGGELARADTGQEGDQHRSGVAGAWRRLRHMNVFFLVFTVIWEKR